jgi:hypothetical protein
MNHEDTLLENQFLELKSYYDKAGLEEKNSGASIFQVGCITVGQLGIQPSGMSSAGTSAIPKN